MAPPSNGPTPSGPTPTPPPSRGGRDYRQETKFRCDGILTSRTISNYKIKIIQ
jgi:hypothetical protein